MKTVCEVAMARVISTIQFLSVEASVAACEFYLFLLQYFYSKIPRIEVVIYVIMSK